MLPIPVPDPLGFADEQSHPELTPVVPSFNRAAPQVAPEELLESLERYKLVARLGEGGMAEVHLAAWEVAPFVHRPVVIKRLHPHFTADARLVQMFLDEARLLTRLDHHNIVKTLEAGVMDGRCCIAMEYLEGQPLHRVLRRAYQRGALPPQLCVSMALSVLDGLHYAHELRDASGQSLDIVHRDVSPQNVFVTNDGQVKVLDFGIAKAKTQQGRTATGIIKGKVGYIAPEQAAAENVDRRADVWSTGVVLWEALTGTRLFKADTDAATLGRALQGEIPSPSSCRAGLPRELDQILGRALQRDRTLRYPDASAMRSDLEQWLARTGHSRDARVVAALMKDLFATEIVEQQRSVSVLMARSDCTPPAPTSNRAPSSTSALIVSHSAAATSADLTRMNEQVQELGKRQRRTVRSLLALLLALTGFAAVVAYFAIARLEPAAPQTRTPTPVVAAAAPIGNADTPPRLPWAQPETPPTTSVQPLAAKPDSSARSEPERKLASAPHARASLAASSALAPSPALPAPEPAASFGYLTIDTSPWSMVSLGGKALGQTPLVSVKLPTGTQLLSLRNPEQHIETNYAVTIENGKTTVRRVGIE